MKEHVESVLMGVDVKDEFLIVRQRTPTVVTCRLADGSENQFGLGRVPPGQHNGTLLWHQDITRVPCDELCMGQHALSSCVLKSCENSCFVLIHVDDIMVVGRKEFVMQKLSKCRYAVLSFFETAHDLH